MSLDIYLEREDDDYLSFNITHNLSKKAKEAGIYELLWYPIEYTQAKDLIAPLTEAIQLMKSNPNRFRPFDAKNSWGTYDQFVPWLERLLIACKENPEAKIKASR